MTTTDSAAVEAAEPDYSDDDGQEWWDGLVGVVRDNTGRHGPTYRLTGPLPTYNLTTGQLRHFRDLLTGILAGESR